MTKRFVVLMALAATLLAACGKEDISVTAKKIGEITVESDSGEVPVLISADGIWKAESLENWIEVDDAWHRDACVVVISYGSNRSVEGLHRPMRIGKVIISTADAAECDTLYVRQKGIEL